MMHIDVIFFVFILLGLYKICRISHYDLKVLFVPHPIPGFWDFNYMNVRLFYIVLWITKALYNFPAFYSLCNSLWIVSTSYLRSLIVLFFAGSNWLVSLSSKF